MPGFLIHGGTINNLILWLCVIGAYYLWMSLMAFDGYFRQIIGHSHHHSHIHKLIWQFHTGLHIDPMRSYGDEKRLRKSAASTNHATPEGAIVYFTTWTRGKRAARRNLIVIGILSLIFGLLVNPGVTLQIFTSTFIIVFALVIVYLVYNVRQQARLRPARKIAPRLLTKNKSVLAATGHPPTTYIAGGTVTSEKPQLDRAVPLSIMSQLLAESIGCSPAETDKLLTIGSDRGTLMLPDHYPALGKQREVLQEIVQGQTKGTISFSWQTTKTPRMVVWVPVVNTLPARVPFSNYVSTLEGLKTGEFGVGLTMGHSVYVSSHNGDTPWHLRSASSGTGKSMGFMCKLAQICHNDPDAEIYCIDTKQVSFEAAHGVPNVHIYDNPESEMREIWRIPYVLEGIMRSRYSELRRRRAKISDYNNIWVLVDEGNDLSGFYRDYYAKHVKSTGDPAQPTVWLEAIAPLINLGRQVKIRGEWMFQNMTDKVLGGVSLRDSFNPVGMAGYKKNQWQRIIGTSPVPECQKGPGRICMVTGSTTTWVQGFSDDTPGWEFLRDYALNGRREV